METKYVWYGNEYISQQEATKRKYESMKQNVLEMKNFCRDCKHWSNCRKAISMNMFNRIWCEYLL